MTETDIIPSPAPDALAPEDKQRQYNLAVRGAELVSLVLSELKFTVDHAALYAPEYEDRRASCRGNVTEFAFDPDEGVCLIGIVWQAEIKSGKKRIARCSAKYTALYQGLTQSETIVRIFAENVAQPATYTYFRALYANLDWSADIKSPPLPVLKFLPKL